jgi:hypothetical protein
MRVVDKGVCAFVGGEKYTSEATVATAAVAASKEKTTEREGGRGRERRRGRRREGRSNFR